MKYPLGIDGGTSGGAALWNGTSWETHVVVKEKIGCHWLLSIEGNIEMLTSLVNKAGGPANVVVAYEQARKNPMFGSKNNYVNGRNEEFWRVILQMLDLEHCSVDPKTWQVCLKGIALEDPKDRAREFIRRRCGETAWLDSLTKASREAVVDAMCIALWCGDQYGCAPTAPSPADLPIRAAA
jgi:hypothetical protein